MLTRFSGEIRLGGTTSASKQKFEGCGERFNERSSSINPICCGSHLQQDCSLKTLLGGDTQPGSTPRQAAETPHACRQLCYKRLRRAVTHRCQSSKCQHLSKPVSCFTKICSLLVLNKSAVPSLSFCPRQ